MSFDKDSESYNFIIYILSGMVTLLLALIAVIYNLMWKSIDALWAAKEKTDTWKTEHAGKISAIEARCEERSKHENND